MDQVEERLTAVMRKVFDNAGLVTRPDMSAKDVEGWDSLANIKLMVSVEKEFKIRIPARELLQIHTVGDLTALIQSKIK